MRHPVDNYLHVVLAINYLGTKETDICGMVLYLNPPHPLLKGPNLMHKYLMIMLICVIALCLMYCLGSLETPLGIHFSKTHKIRMSQH